MSKKLAMANNQYEDFESWNVDDESNRLAEINIPNETKEFMNILQINKGNVNQMNNEFMNFSDSFSNLDFEELRDVVILENNEENKSESSKLSDNEEPNQFLWVSSIYIPQERIRRSQQYSNLFKSNLWDKHWRDMPSVEILSVIMKQKVNDSRL